MNSSDPGTIHNPRKGSQDKKALSQSMTQGFFHVIAHRTALNAAR